MSLSNLKVETLSEKDLNALRGGKTVVFERTFTKTTIDSDGNVQNIRLQSGFMMTARLKELNNIM